MATIADLPAQYKPYCRACNKGFQKIIDIIYDTPATGATGQQKADRIAEIHGLIQGAITEIEKLCVTGTVDVEGQMDAIIAKPIIPA